MSSSPCLRPEQPASTGAGSFRFLPGLVLFGLLALPAQARAAVDPPPGFEDGLVWRVVLAYEEYRPMVAGQERELVQRHAELRLEEPLGRGLYGGLRGGLTSTRWSGEEADQLSRHPGHLFGLQLGGRHRLAGALRFNWEVSYTWNGIEGEQGDEQLRLSWFESFARAGLAVPLGPFSLEAGAEWREFDGEERLGNGTRRERSMRLDDDTRPYLTLGLALDTGGGIALRVAGDGEERNIALLFSRQFYW
jgi:opacity protein-like surface antigen